MGELKASSGGVQSVDRALELLDILKEEPKGIGITELASRMGLAKSTIHRIASSLKAKSYLKQDPLTQRYHLGIKLIEMGAIVTQRLEIRAIAEPFMKRMVDEIGETSHLVIMEGGEIAYIEKIESPNTIRMVSFIGRRAPVHCTGAGKALLAFLPEPQIIDTIDRMGLRKYTATTITDQTALLEELQAIRMHGYSVDNEEHEDGIRCIAAPIFNHAGQAVAGVSIAGPAMRMTDEKIKTCIPVITQCAMQISKELCYQV